MSMPAIVGHPDWQEYANWRGLLAGNPTTLVPPGTNNFGPYVVTNYASLFLDFKPLSGKGQIFVTYYTDTTLNNEIDYFSWYWFTGSLLQVYVPNLGPVAVVDIENDSGANVTALFFVEPMNVPVAKLTYEQNPGVDARLGATIAGGATVNVYTLALVGGPAYIHFDANTGYNKLSMVISAVDYNQNVTSEYFKVNVPSGPVNASFIAPQAPLQVRVVNTDAVNSYTYSWTLARQSQS